MIRLLLATLLLLPTPPSLTPNSTALPIEGNLRLTADAMGRVCISVDTGGDEGKLPTHDLWVVEAATYTVPQTQLLQARVHRLEHALVIEHPPTSTALIFSLAGPDHRETTDEISSAAQVEASKIYLYPATRIHRYEKQVHQDLALDCPAPLFTKAGN